MPELGTRVEEYLEKYPVHEQEGGNRFAFILLAPDIIESILEGRQPQDLNFEKLCRHIPLSWAEQREQFGFSTIQTQRTSRSLTQ
jgi:hypothetical protein